MDKVKAVWPMIKGALAALVSFLGPAGRLIARALDHERRSIVALANTVLRSPTLWLASATIVVGMFVLGFGAGTAGKGRLRNQLTQASTIIDGQRANIVGLEAARGRLTAEVAALKKQIEAARAEAAVNARAPEPRRATSAPRVSRRPPRVAANPPVPQWPSWVPWQ